MINPNSLVAYFGTQPSIGRKQMQVLEAIIELVVCSDSEIEEYLQKKYPLEKWRINKITNRRGELLNDKKLIVIVDGAFHNEDGYPINKYKINPDYKLEKSHLRPEIKRMILEQRVQPKMV